MDLQRIKQEGADDRDDYTAQDRKVGHHRFLQSSFRNGDGNSQGPLPAKDVLSKYNIYFETPEEAELNSPELPSTHNPLLDRLTDETICKEELHLDYEEHNHFPLDNLTPRNVQPHSSTKPPVGHLQQRLEAPQAKLHPALRQTIDHLPEIYLRPLNRPQEQARPTTKQAVEAFPQGPVAPPRQGVDLHAQAQQKRVMDHLLQRQLHPYQQKQRVDPPNAFIKQEKDVAPPSPMGYPFQKHTMEQLTQLHPFQRPPLDSLTHPQVYHSQKPVMGRLAQALQQPFPNRAMNHLPQAQFHHSYQKQAMEQLANPFQSPPLNPYQKFQPALNPYQQQQPLDPLTPGRPYPLPEQPRNLPYLSQARDRLAVVQNSPFQTPSVDEPPVHPLLKEAREQLAQIRLNAAKQQANSQLQRSQAFERPHPTVPGQMGPRPAVPEPQQSRNHLVQLQVRPYMEQQAPTRGAHVNVQANFSKIAMMYANSILNERHESQPEERPETQNKEPSHTREMSSRGDVREEPTIPPPEIKTELLPETNSNLSNDGSEFGLDSFESEPLSTEGVGSLPCPVCKKVFGHLRHLNMHLVNHSNEGAPFTCPICSKTITQKGNLFRHLCTHTGYRPYSCNFCGKSFIEKKCMNRHLQSHGQNICHFCMQYFLTRGELKRHLESCHDGETMSSEGNEKEEVIKIPHLSEITVTRRPVAEARNETEAEALPGHFMDAVAEDSDKETPEPLPQYVSGRDEPSTCDICSEVFSNSALLTTHILTHTSQAAIGPLPCPICQKSISQKHNMFKHLCIHTGHRPFMCPVCGRGFIEKKSLKRHIPTHERGKSLLPALATPLSDELPTEETEKESGASYTCFVCNKLFSKNSFLTAHLLTHTSETSPFECPICKKPASQKSILYKHLCLHTGYRPYTCNICGRGFSERKGLANHLRQHEKQKSVNSCLKCNKSFGSSSLLKIHMMAYHNAVQIPKLPLPVTEEGTGPLEEDSLNAGSIVSDENEAHDENPEVPVCVICSQTFADKKTLTMHLTVHSSEESPYPCPVCLKKTITKQGLVKHLCLHTGFRTCTCQYCGRVFMDKSHLNDHLRVHTKERPFSCEVCNMSFSWRPQYKKHIESGCSGSASGEASRDADTSRDAVTADNTTGEDNACFREVMAANQDTPSYCCNLCNTVFSDRCKLTTHLVSHSSKVRPFPCPVCGKDFDQKRNMERHLRIHTGYHPFSCEVCGKTFSDATSHTKHKMTHAANGPIFPCKLCPKLFIREHYLEKHVQNVHSSSVPSDTSSQPAAATSDQNGSSEGRLLQDPFFLKSLGFRKEHKKKKKKNKERPANWKCRVCKVIFSDKSAFQVHYVQHFYHFYSYSKIFKVDYKLRPHRCFLCRKSYFQKCHLKCHVCTIRPQPYSTYRPYRCVICRESFALKSLLNSHVGLHY